MSLVPAAVEPPAVAEIRPPRVRNAAQWLVISGYLAGAVAVTWRLWADPAGRVQVGDIPDVNLFAWFMHYDAIAIAHGHLPALLTAAMNAPRGINLMWNTSFLLPGIALAPVTLLAGPQVSLTVMLTLGFTGSAAALFWVLRRWGASVGASALGGAVYGFSPALLNSGIGHYHLEFAVLPPLIIDRVLRIVTGRGRAARDGIWLGLLVSAQLFVSEEILADTALTCLAVAGILAASHRHEVRDRARDGAFGIGISIGVALVICGKALWTQFSGPLTQHNALAGTDRITNRPSFFVDPAGNMLLHTSGSAAAAAAYSPGLPEYLGYLGWPLLAVLAVAMIRYWRDQRVRLAAVVWLVLTVLSLGGGTMHNGAFSFPGAVLPFHWLQDAPVLSAVLPDRLSILADGAAGAVLAFSLDRARLAAPRGWTWRRTAPAAVAVLAVMPLIPLPYQVTPVTPAPAGWQAAFTRLRLAPGARVLVVPVGSQRRPEVLRWAADTGDPASMIGGYFVGPDKSGQEAIYIPGPASTAAQYLDALWNGPEPAASLPHGLLRSDLAYWRPAAVVAVTGRSTRLGVFLTGTFGRPAFVVGGVMAWHLHIVPGRQPRQRRLA
ncbi:MAG TPA: hypothetical protein VMF87_23765 [Streptosporangiaceae bacterium]|nr:hypothetical protein [Streptosporangiaceae bacterium]